jgi:hypothetical protein
LLGFRARLSFASTRTPESRDAGHHDLTISNLTLITEA